MNIEEYLKTSAGWKWIIGSSVVFFLSVMVVVFLEQNGIELDNPLSLIIVTGFSGLLTLILLILRYKEEVRLTICIILVLAILYTIYLMFDPSNTYIAIGLIYLIPLLAMLGRPYLGSGLPVNIRYPVVGFLLLAIGLPLVLANLM